MSESDITSDQILNEQEKTIEKTLRPQYLRQYLGQNKIKQQLQIYIQAAQKRQESLDHVWDKERRLILCIIHCRLLL